MEKEFIYYPEDWEIEYLTWEEAIERFWITEICLQSIRYFNTMRLSIWEWDEFHILELNEKYI